jgi:hypothetical protein
VRNYELGRNGEGVRVSRRFERARIEAQLFAEVCDILLSALSPRHEPPSGEQPAAPPAVGSAAYRRKSSHERKLTRGVR